MYFAGQIANFLGGTLRWIYGSIWRTLFNRPKFTFKDYIYGPKNGDHYDKHGHELNNKIIAFIFIGIAIALLSK